MYQNCIDNPCDDHKKKYKSHWNEVTPLIREAKRNDNIKKLGKNPDSKTIYKLLGIKKRQQQVSNLPDIEVMKEYWSEVTFNLPEIQAKLHIDRLQKTLVVCQTIPSEVTKVLRQKKCKKVMAKMASPMK